MIRPNDLYVAYVSITKCRLSENWVCLFVYNHIFSGLIRKWLGVSILHFQMSCSCAISLKINSIAYISTKCLYNNSKLNINSPAVAAVSTNYNCSLFTGYSYRIELSLVIWIKQHTQTFDSGKNSHTEKNISRQWLWFKLLKNVYASCACSFSNRNHEMI